QRKALTYFLEYLFLIQDNKLSEEFKEVRDKIGGAVEMSIDEIREIYLEERGIEKGKEEGREEGEKLKQIEIAKNGIKQGLNVEIISTLTGLSVEEIEKLK
ncbi:MAG: Rpn family recombination-promoting nuclease/putative transposase, partial [Sarcina sp.]